MSPKAVTPEFIRSLEFEGRSALVTGGASGIGWATAQLLAHAGARVMIADIDAARADARAQELGSSHLGIGVDIAIGHEVAKMIERCASAFGGIDVLINNAGLTTTGGVGVVDQPVAEFDRIMTVNLGGTVAASDHAARVMKAAGRGVIVNLASGAGLRPVPFRGAYSASKAGIIALTRGQAATWRRDGIRVNAVAPGYTRTELVEALIAIGRVDPEAAARRIPLGRMAEPQEIAAVIAFLASERSAAIWGQVFVVDGGSMVAGGSTTSRAIERVAGSRAGPPTYLVAGVDTDLGAAVAKTLSKWGARILSARIEKSSSFGLVDALDIDDCLHVDAVCDGTFNASVESALAGGRALDGVVCVAAMTETPVDVLRRVVRATGLLLTTAGGGSFVTIAGDRDEEQSAVDVAVLTMLTRTLAVEWSDRRVRANVIETSRNSRSRAREIGEIAQFLLSAEAGYVTGSAIKAT